VIGGVGLLVGATMLATIPNKTKVEQSIVEIDSELARLRQLQEASK
jgi:hypothetical protein